VNTFVNTMNNKPPKKCQRYFRNRGLRVIRWRMGRGWG
jgi:hypothetical protein